MTAMAKSSTLSPLKIIFVVLMINCLLPENTKAVLECEKSCTNKVVFTDDVLESKISKTSEVEVNWTKYPGFTDVYVLKRKVYSIWMTKHFGNRPKQIISQNVIPGKIEGLEWQKKNMCQIGELCLPDGDCWGADAKKCQDQKPTTYVDARSFQYEYTQWDAAFRDTCTKDWSCSINKYSMPVYVNDMRKPYVVVEGQIINLSTTDDTYQKLPNMAIYIAPIVKHSALLKAKCFQEKGDIYCEVLEDSKDHFIHFTSENDCTIQGSAVYCVGGSIRTRLYNIRKEAIASLDDLQRLSDAVYGLEMRNNYNSYLIGKEFQNVRTFINKLVGELSKFEPALLGKLVGKSIMTRSDANDNLLSCKCKEKGSKHTTCKISNESKGSGKVCSNSTLPKIKFSLYGNISLEDDFIIDEEYRGATIDVFEDSIEKEDETNTRFDNKADYSLSVNVPWYLDPTGWLSAFMDKIGFVALGLSIFNFFRR